MIGRRAVVGLSLLSALLFCAFAAQSASAAKAVNTTMFTCVKVGPNLGDFKDAHCDEKVEPKKGEFAHEKVANGVTTEITATNEKVTNSTKDKELAVLESQFLLTKIEITCEVVKNNAKESLVHNETSEVSKHTITGTIVTNFEKCIVVKPAKCTVKTPIVSEASFESVEKLGAGANEMGGELKGKGGAEKTTFASITFEGSECSLKGKTFEVTGSVIGTSGPTTTSSQTNHWSGATVVFTPEKEMQNLKLGAEPAKFKTIVTQTGPANPIVGTTCTTTSNC